ncbi:hypothetical protein JD844_014231 [Phrynosoma platyrhinos]|uniref:Uncharacterized protein n=1 Tax=Phrynosoma platyrhinos TaxID=52577 RepID=A0ABQ7SRA7_PHRPL|nr:hypothetical protein JD844_014231 [Phrynosoma platyrhinos]
MFLQAMAGKPREPRVPMTLQKSRLKAEEKILDFDFELTSVQFNEMGRYALRLTVENPLLEGSGAGVQLLVNEGFCKNDKNHDARLRIEALRLHGSSLKSSIKTGEAFFAIYPRTNQPRMNLFASRDEDVYRYSDIMVLLRVGPDDLAMHCGRLAYTVSFHEHRPITQRKIPITPRRLSPLPPTKTEELVIEPPDLHQKVPPAEVENPSDDEDLSLPSSSSSSPALLRRLPSDASLHFPSPGDSPKLNFEDTFSRVQVAIWVKSLACLLI